MKSRFLKATFEPKQSDRYDSNFAVLLADVLLKLNIADYAKPTEYTGGTLKVEVKLHFNCYRSNDEVKTELEKLCSIGIFRMTEFEITEKEAPPVNPA